MTKNVTLKSFAGGITVVLSESAPFRLLMDDVRDSFKEAASFFKTSSMVIRYQGRMMSEEEVDILTGIIRENSDIHIICVVCTDVVQTDYFFQILDTVFFKQREKNMPVDINTAEIHRGDLKDGDLFESNGNAIIMGDVKPGAAVIAKGDIVVLGACLGTLHAGSAGDEERMIIALSLGAEHIRIAETKASAAEIAKLMPKSLLGGSKKLAKQVTLCEGTLCIKDYPLDKG